jgi:hypothetical protein
VYWNETIHKNNFRSSVFHHHFLQSTHRSTWKVGTFNLSCAHRAKRWYVYPWSRTPSKCCSHYSTQKVKFWISGYLSNPRSI